MAIVVEFIKDIGLLMLGAAIGVGVFSIVKFRSAKDL